MSTNLSPVQFFHTLEILKAGNKRFNNKTAYYSVKENTIKIGRTTYKVELGSHQPNIPNDDYTCVDHTIKTAKRILMHKTSVTHLNSGMWITKFKLID